MARLFHIFLAPILRDCEKVEGRAGEERARSLRETLRNYVLGRKNVIYGILLLSLRRLYFSFVFLTFALAHTRVVKRAAPRRSLILSYVLFDNLSRFFSYTVVPSFKDYSG